MKGILQCNHDGDSDICQDTTHLGDWEACAGDKEEGVGIVDGAKDELMVALDEEADAASSPPSVSPPFPPRLPTTNGARSRQRNSCMPKIIEM